MGSLEENLILELHDESQIGKMMHPLNAPQGRWFHFAGSECFGSKSIGHNVLKSIKIVLFSDKINFLIPFGPLAILVDRLTNNHGWVFFLSLVGMIPLAERLSWMTEQLVFYTGPTVGGLLIATFGNVAELIISIYAMKNGMLRVVQQSLLGSILSNMLLVLGCAFFAGGIVNRNKEQVFNKANATMSCGLLLMAVMGLLFPTVLHFTHTEMHFEKSELSLSRYSSCVMLVAYCGYLLFQLTGESNQYALLDEEASPTVESWDDGEMPYISKLEIVIWLSILTLWISVLSEYLVNAIEGAFVLMNIPIAFITVILLPLVGNAAEHAAAVIFAVKDKLDISLGVAIGSSTQISMFAIPFCVVVGWIMGHPLDLNFQPFETSTLFISVLVVASMLQVGTSNYFKGLLLILCYMIVAAGFFVHIDPKPTQRHESKGIVMDGGINVRQFEENQARHGQLLTKLRNSQVKLQQSVGTLNHKLEAMDSRFDVLESKFSELSTLIKRYFVKVQPRIPEEAEVNSNISIDTGILNVHPTSAGLVNQPGKFYSCSKSFTRTLPMKLVTYEEMKLRREKGCCHYCDEVFQVGHKCKNQCLYMIKEEGKEIAEEEEGLVRHAKCSMNVLQGTRVVQRGSMEFQSTESIVAARYVEEENHQEAKKDKPKMDRSYCSMTLLRTENGIGEILKDMDQVFKNCGSYARQVFQNSEHADDKYRRTNGNMEQRCIPSIIHKLLLNNGGIREGTIYEFMLDVITFMFDPGGCNITIGVGKMGYCSYEESDISEFEMVDYKEKPYEQLMAGIYKVKGFNGILRYPFCAGKKKQNYKYKDMLQHASGVGKGSSNSSAKQMVNLLALAIYLDVDLATEAAPVQQAAAPVLVVQSYDQNVFYCRPGTGIIVYIVTETDSEKNVKSKYYWLNKFPKYKPSEVEILQDEQKQTSQTMLLIDYDWSGFKNVMEFEKFFESDRHSKKEWSAWKDAAGFSIYVWLACEDDYNSEGPVGNVLRKKGKLRAIARFVHEAQQGKKIMVANLVNDIDKKNENLNDFQIKYIEKNLSLNRMLEENDIIHHALYEETRKMQRLAREQVKMMLEELEGIHHSSLIKCLEFGKIKVWFQFSNYSWDPGGMCKWVKVISWLVDFWSQPLCSYLYCQKTLDSSCEMPEGYRSRFMDLTRVQSGSMLKNAVIKYQSCWWDCAPCFATSLDAHLLPLDSPELQSLTGSRGIEKIAWDGSGERLALSYKDGDDLYKGLIAIYDVKRACLIAPSLISFIRRPGDDLKPITFSFMISLNRDHCFQCLEQWILLHTHSPSFG